jgi:hypothetical protein
VTVKQAAEYLTARDYPCKAGVVRALVHAKRLRCHRIGATGRGPMAFSAAELDAFLERSLSATPSSSSRPAAPKAPTVPTRASVPDWRARMKAVAGR